MGILSHPPEPSGRETWHQDLMALLVPCWPVLLVAVSAVDRATLCRLERYFAFLATVCAYGLVHLSWTTIEVTPSSITHFFHSFSFSYTQKLIPQYSSYTDQLAVNLAFKPIVRAQQLWSLPSKSDIRMSARMPRASVPVFYRVTVLLHPLTISIRLIVRSKAK